MSRPFFDSFILAAGHSKRFKSDVPKILHPLAGRPLLYHLLDTVQSLHSHNICLITSPSLAEARAEVTLNFPSVQHRIQKEPLGTAHALLSAEALLEKSEGLVLVLYGDVPLISGDTLKKLLKAGESAAITVLGMRPESCEGYGRIFCDEEGQIDRIIEHKDADEAQRKHTLCSSGIMVLQGKVALGLLKKIKNKNAQGEYYLTDIIHSARTCGLKTQVIEADYQELQGVNTREDLATANFYFQQNFRRKVMAKGVTLEDPLTVYFSYDTVVEQDVVIEPNVYFGPGVVLHKNVHIKANSYLEGCTVHSRATIGPFARLRHQSTLAEGVRVGNFVEIKNSKIGPCSKIPHLSYVGDAEIGKEVNVGAGVITCNYDGVKKHKTTLEDHVFVGSNTALVAPLRVKKGAVIGAGSVITKDVPSEALALTRSEQKIIPNKGRSSRNRT